MIQMSTSVFNLVQAMMDSWGLGDTEGLTTEEIN